MPTLGNMGTFHAMVQKPLECIGLFSFSTGAVLSDSLPPCEDVAEDDNISLGPLETSYCSKVVMTVKASIDMM